MPGWNDEPVTVQSFGGRRYLHGSLPGSKSGLIDQSLDVSRSIFCRIRRTHRVRKRSPLHQQAARSKREHGHSRDDARGRAFDTPGLRTGARVENNNSEIASRSVFALVRVRGNFHLNNAPIRSSLTVLLTLVESLDTSLRGLARRRKIENILQCCVQRVVIHKSQLRFGAIRWAGHSSWS